MKLSTNTAVAVTSFATAGVKRNQASKLAVDGLVADGVTPEALKAPAKGEDRAFYDSMVQLIQNGMPKAAQALLNADIKALTEAQKIERRYQQMQRGSLLKDLVKALKRRLDSTERGPAAKRTPKARVLASFEHIKEMIRKMEDPDFEVVKVMAGLDTIVKLLK